MSAENPYPSVKSNEFPQKNKEIPIQAVIDFIERNYEFGVAEFAFPDKVIKSPVLRYISTTEAKVCELAADEIHYVTYTDYEHGDQDPQRELPRWAIELHEMYKNTFKRKQVNYYPRYIKTETTLTFLRFIEQTMGNLLDTE